MSSASSLNRGPAPWFEVMPGVNRCRVGCRHVAQEVEQVTGKGCCDPRLLLAMSVEVSLSETPSPSLLKASCLSPCIVDTAVGVCEFVCE